MAQNVTIAGASYLGVPRIEMPKTGGGTAVFVDTSDANAAAGDITKGKTAYVGGTKITGTLEASSVSVQDTKAVTITSNGTVSVTPDAPYDALKKVDVTVNVASGGGALSVETGTLTSTKIIVGPNAYNYTFDISPISNINDRSVIILISQDSYKPAFMLSSIQVLAVFVRLDKYDEFCMYGGGGLYQCTEFSIGSSWIELIEAYIGDPSLETPSYIAI